MPKYRAFAAKGSTAKTLTASLNKSFEELSKGPWKLHQIFETDDGLVLLCADEAKEHEELRIRTELIKNMLPAVRPTDEEGFEPSEETTSFVNGIIYALPPGELTTVLERTAQLVRRRVCGMNIEELKQLVAEIEELINEHNKECDDRSDQVALLDRMRATIIEEANKLIC